jgi:hypothetical protein
MSKHKLTYVDMYPEAVGRVRPVPLWRIVLGAACTMAALWAVTFILFSM